MCLRYGEKGLRIRQSPLTDHGRVIRRSVRLLMAAKLRRLDPSHASALGRPFSFLGQRRPSYAAKLLFKTSRDCYWTSHMIVKHHAGRISVSRPAKAGGQT